MFDFLKKLFKREEKIDWSKAKLIVDTKKRLNIVGKPSDESVEEKKILEHIKEKISKEAKPKQEPIVKDLEEVEKIEAKAIKVYEGFLICDRDKVENVEEVLRTIKEKDPTFPNIDRRAYLVVLIANNRDDLHKRLSWVVKNVDGTLGYFIREVK